MYINDPATHSIERTVARAYDRARQRNLLQWLRCTLRRCVDTLYDFNEVRNRLPVCGQRDAGLQTVPMQCIVGSVGRATDFDSAFHPRRTTTAERWKSVARAVYTGKFLPPVELIKVGALYFVVDGNHRVSVKRQQGQDAIDAHVIELDTPACLCTAAQLGQLLATGPTGQSCEARNV